MRRRAGLIVAGILALDLLATAYLLVGPPVQGLGHAESVGVATLARFGLSLTWIWLCDSFPRAITVTALLLGLESLAFIYVLFPGRLARSDDQEWAHLPVLICSYTFGPALLLLLVMFLVAHALARRRAVNTR